MRGKGIIRGWRWLEGLRFRVFPRTAIVVSAMVCYD